MTAQPTAEEIERIRRVLKDEDVLEMLSNTHTCYEADEDHGGVGDDDVTGGTVQRARDLELAMNWLRPGYISDAFPQEWILAELTKLRTENLAMRKALEEISRGEGIFSRDPLTHAVNTIDSMKQIARDALEPEQSGATG